MWWALYSCRWKLRTLRLLSERILFFSHPKPRRMTIGDCTVIVSSVITISKVERTFAALSRWFRVMLKRGRRYTSYRTQVKEKSKSQSVFFVSGAHVMVSFKSHLSTKNASIKIVRDYRSNFDEFRHRTQRHRRLASSRPERVHVVTVAHDSRRGLTHQNDVHELTA